jgi:hypothetical protein
VLVLLAWDHRMVNENGQIATAYRRFESDKALAYFNALINNEICYKDADYCKK